MHLLNLRHLKDRKRPKRSEDSANTLGALRPLLGNSKYLLVCQKFLCGPSISGVGFRRSLRGGGC